MKLRFIIAIIFCFLFLYNNSYAQLFPRFSIAGGPTVGWFRNNTDDLNAEMRKIGLPEFPKDGFITLGGGGFIDLPIKSLPWLRLGGMGTGFSVKRSVTDANNQTRTVNYDYGMGGMSFEYVHSFSRRFEMSGGVLLATGKLTLDMYQSNTGFGNWNNIFGELSGGNSTANFSHKLSVRFYSAQPQIGFGLFITNFLYAKLNAGYQFSANSDWKVDDNITVSNAPAGIKAEGFNVNFGLNVGLFTK